MSVFACQSRPPAKQAGKGPCPTKPANQEGAAKSKQLVTNLADRREKPLRVGDCDKVGEISLQLFLAMSLMSMDLSSLASQSLCVRIPIAAFAWYEAGSHPES